MTTLKFSKTRIVYWDSGRSSFTLPKDPQTLPTGVTLLDDDETTPYRVAKAVGQDSANKTVGHQWHIIPYNNYGLYCTPSEINALYENSNSICPVKMNFVVGHTIPLSKTATATTTQLSFNNTIYSLIVDLPGNDHVTPKSSFTSGTEFNAFCRTFDGSRYDNLNRNVLPIPDILFKVPRVINNPYYTVQQNKSAPNSSKNVGFFSQKGGFNCYSQIGALNAYLPELLQDNTNVKCLYPGENQDMFSVDCSPYSDIATIPTDSINFNETFANLDSRANVINSNLPFPHDLACHMAVVPTLRGPLSLFKKSTVTPYDHDLDNNAASDSDKLSWVLWSEIIQSKHGMRHEDCFTPPLPHKFIKCLPIMAQDNNVVDHTICGTVTWTLEVSVTNRLYKNINPLKWEMLWPYRYSTVTIDDGGNVTNVVMNNVMVSSQGMRPLNDKHYKSLQKRRRENQSLNANNSANPNNNSFTPQTATDSTPNASAGFPLDVINDPGYWSNAVYNDLHTASFGLRQGVTTRSKSRAKKRTSAPASSGTGGAEKCGE